LYGDVIWKQNLFLKFSQTALRLSLIKIVLYDVKVPENHIDKILTKWLTDSVSQEELQILKDWASQDAANLEIMETLKLVWSEKTSEPILVNVEDRISEIWQRGVVNKPKRTLGRNLWAKYAAVIFLLVSSSFGILFFSQMEK
jgi:transmembrane sensor